MATKTPTRAYSASDTPPGLGLYDFWNAGRGKRYSALHQRSRYTAALVELPAAGAIDARPGKSDSETATGVWFPTLWKEPDKLKFVPFVVQEPERPATTDSPDELEHRLVNGLKKAKSHVQGPDAGQARFRVAFPVEADAMKPDLPLRPTSPNWRPDPGLRRRIRKKRIVIIAIIDDGLPFAHRNFRDASGQRTRVEFCWLQSARSNPEQTSVLFGREYTRSQIERYIEDFGDDEDVLYHEAGATSDKGEFASMIGRHTTHGAHVMDLATGYAPERDEEPAEEIRIIAVQLPNVVTMDTSGFGKDMYLLSAFHYIFHRADLIAKKYRIKKPRLVINFSYGYSGGRHDGEVDVEAAIEELVKLRRSEIGPTALVVPAGNTFLDRMHVEIAGAAIAKAPAKLPWRLQPNDRTPSYLEIWFPDKFDASDYTIDAQDPWGTSCGVLSVGRGRQTVLLYNRAGEPVGQISAEQQKTDSWRVLIVTAPSEPGDPELPGIDAGVWNIVIARGEGAQVPKEAIRCWIQRDSDPLTMRSGARQSYFDDLQDERYNFGGSSCNDGRFVSQASGSLREKDTRAAFVRRFGSLNGLAAIPSAIAVAGLRLGADPFQLGVGPDSSLKQLLPARYSCAGTQRSGWPVVRVSCASMSDRSNILVGTVAAGVRSGALSIMDGTSAAAPFVARKLATVFVTASDAAVERAAQREKEEYKRQAKGNAGQDEAGESNYRSLLLRAGPDRGQIRKRDRSQNKKDGRQDKKDGYRSLRKDRLGTALVLPVRQPGWNIEQIALSNDELELRNSQARREALAAARQKDYARCATRARPPART